MRAAILACTLLIAGAVASAGPIQLDISSGFNMDGLCGSSEWTTLKGQTTYYNDYFGREPQGYSSMNYDVFCPVVNNGDDFTLGFPSDGVVTTSYGTYHMAGNAGNTTLSGNWADNKKNVIEFGHVNASGGWAAMSVTVTLPAAQQGKYSDVNFLMDAGSGWPYFYIQADYSDGSHQTIFDYMQNIGGSLYGGTWNGPGVSGVGLVDPNFYHQALQVTQIGENWNDNNHVKYQYDWTYGPMGVWEMATPAALDPDKTLVSFTFVDGTGDDTSYNHVQYIWAASATPAPEPCTLVVLGLGALGAFVRGRKRA